MKKFRVGFWALLTCITLSNVSLAQDDDSKVEEVIVSGIRASAGGAQDINFFRGEVKSARIPHPSTLTAEGLFSQHDLLLTSDDECGQLFCLIGESMPADLIAQPEAKILVGLGFTTNVSGDTWRRAPLNLVAVVDKSGSMDGEPLKMVKASLNKIVERLKENDQLSIVLYGDRAHVYLVSTKTTRTHKKAILKAIDAIESNGSTFMEAGLKLGYQTAFESMGTFKGSTRLMLFTDERPNVGKTDADSFMGIAQAASHKGVGLTTIGVGRQFGAELATKISSIRGGNLFFIESERDVNTLYDQELDYMVSELAHDLQINITATSDYSIAGIYGVPGETLGWQKDKTVSITIPTVFFSTKAGALFFSLARNIEDAHLPAKPVAMGGFLASVDMQYVPAAGGKPERYSLTIANNTGEASESMKLGHFLVDEYTALYHATSEHYFNNDQEKAYQIMHALKGRLGQSGSPALDAEKELVYALEERFAFISGHGSERGRDLNFTKLWGVWEVYRVRGNLIWEKGDKIMFTPDNHIKVYRGNGDQYELIAEEEYQSNNRQIYLDYHELTFGYRFSGNRLLLEHRRRSKGAVRLVKSDVKPADLSGF